MYLDKIYIKWFSLNFKPWSYNIDQWISQLFLLYSCKPNIKSDENYVYCKVEFSCIFFTFEWVFEYFCCIKRSKNSFINYLKISSAVYEYYFETDSYEYKMQQEKRKEAWLYNIIVHKKTLENGLNLAIHLYEYMGFPIIKPVWTIFSQNNLDSVWTTYNNPWASKLYSFRTETHRLSSKFWVELF